MQKLTVVLSNVGNIDFGQIPTRPLPRTQDEIVTVNSLKEAREACHRYINKNRLGGGNWTGGQVYDENEKPVARISYNGRIWEWDGHTEWTINTKEIII